MKKYHRWFGLVLSVFMLVFCVSGIILNHRSLFRSCEVSRGWMPTSYHICNFNNGIIKGTLSLRDDSCAVGNYSLGDGSTVGVSKVIAFGGAGVWLTDSRAKQWLDYNQGLPEGADNRTIRNIVQTQDGSLWMAAQYDVYHHDGKRWQRVELPGNEARISDIALNGDSTQVVALTRDAAYVILPSVGQNVGLGRAKDCYRQIKMKVLAAPNGYKPETTLFKTVWKLHSGEFFGLPGKLVVDAIAVVLIVLSLTGIILFILPYGIRSQKRKGKKEVIKKMGKQMVWNQKWHNKIGYATIILTLWLSVTGMCLRPPLMIPLVLTKTPQSVENGNVWQDKLRGIRWDEAQGCWLVSTSEGFLKVDADFQKAPVFFDKDKAPVISPMGITVFERIKADEWLVGSFSGLYRWNAQTGRVVDAFTGKPEDKKTMRPVSNSLVSGYSGDFLGGKSLIFDYAKGAQEMGKLMSESAMSDKSMSDNATETAPLVMPEILSHAKMSLWNVALELHVGRCYTPFLGPISDLFVFLSGLLISLVLLSGFIILHRQKRKRKQHAQRNVAKES